MKLFDKKSPGPWWAIGHPDDPILSQVEKLPTNPTSTAQSSDTLRMKGCQLIYMAVHDYVDDFVDYAKRFLADPEARAAARQSLPFDDGVEGCVRFINDGCIIDEMGVHLMRMDLDPEVYSMGLVLTLKESRFHDEKKYVVYTNACLSLDDALALVNEPSFRDEAELTFRRCVEDYFYPKKQ